MSIKPCIVYTRQKGECSVVYRYNAYFTENKSGYATIYTDINNLRKSFLMRVNTNVINNTSVSVNGTITIVFTDLSVNHDDEAMEYFRKKLQKERKQAYRTYLRLDIGLHSLINGDVDPMKLPPEETNVIGHYKIKNTDTKG